MEILVLDPLPLFRLGVIAALGGGREVEPDDDLEGRLSTAAATVLFVTVPDQDAARAFAPVSAAAQYAHVHPVALLTSYSDARAAQALHAGATTVAPRDIAAPGLRQILDELRRGVVRLPTRLVQMARAERPDRSFGPTPSDDELQWLRMLSRGATVSSIAEACQLSERVLYRRLNVLYHRIGASNRVEALMLGHTHGWI